MELKMEVYSPSLELLGLLETYDSLIIEDWAFKPGSFSLESIFNATTKTLLQPENIIWMEGETAGIIEFVQASASESGYTLSVKGSLLAGILSRRILWGTYALYDSTPKIMYDMVNDCAISPTKGLTTQRIIPNLILDGEPPEDTRKIRKQSTGDVLTDFLSEIGQAGGVAYGVKFNAAALKMEFWARVGVDRTINQTAVDPVLYSTELDDVLSSEYSYDSSRYQNIALVAGEGEGENRKTETVFEGSGSSEPPSDVIPFGYQRLEYIESTGEQYIDTGYKPTALTRAVIDMQATKLPPSNTVIFGTRGTGGATAPLMFALFLPAQQNRIRTDYFGTSKSGAIIDNQIRMTVDKNANVTSVQGYSYSNTEVDGSLECEHTMYLFALNDSGYVNLYCSYKLYSFKVYGKDGDLLMDCIPCKNPDGDIGVYDAVNLVFLKNSGSGEFISGPEVDALLLDSGLEPGGLYRRELYVDARDLQQLSLDNPMTSDEYTEALITRGQEKLSDAQLIQSFSATVRTLNPTYEYGVDFLLGDTITVTDERLGLSVSAVVDGVERSVGKNGEDMILTLGYGLPTISDRLRKAGV